MYYSVTVEVRRYLLGPGAPPPTMWVSGIKLRTPGVAAIPLPAELSHQP